MKRMIAAVLCLCLLLSGCAAAQDPGVTESVGVRLRVVTSYGNEDGNRKQYEAAVAEYERLTGNTVLDNSDVSNEEWKARVLTDFETGSEPDVLFFFANADAEPLIRADKVVSLREIRESFPDYAANMEESRLPAASNGEHYAVPIMGYWEYLYVNRQVLDTCGVPLPGADYSWEQFLRDCETIRQAGFTPIACSLAEVSHYWFEYAVMNNGSAEDHHEIPRLDETGHLIDDAAARKWIAGLEDIRDLYDRGFFPANTLTAGDAQTAALFGSDQAAFLLDGSWKLGYLRENYADSLEHYAVCHVPAKGLRAPTDTVGGISTGFFITRRAWNDPARREAAVAFVSLLTSDAVVGTFVTTEMTALKQDTIPAGLDPLQQSAALTRSGTTRLVSAVQDSITGEARASLFASIQNVVTGKLTAWEAVESAMQLN